MLLPVSLLKAWNLRPHSDLLSQSQHLLRNEMQVNKWSCNEITLQKNFNGRESLVTVGAMVSLKEGEH